MTRWFVLHGAVVLWTGLAGGYFHARAINTGQHEVAWRVVHSGASMGGTMLLAMAWPLRFVELPAWGIGTLAWTLLGGTYFLVAGMIIAAITGDRGIASGGGRINRLVHFLYALGGSAALVGCSLFLIGVARGLQEVPK